MMGALEKNQMHPTKSMNIGSQNHTFILPLMVLVTLGRLTT